MYGNIVIFFRRLPIKISVIAFLAFVLTTVHADAATLRFNFEQTKTSRIDVSGYIDVDCMGSGPDCSFVGMDILLDSQDAVNLTDAFSNKKKRKKYGLVVDNSAKTVRFTKASIFKVFSLQVDQTTGTLLDFVANWRNGDAGLMFTSPNLIGKGKRPGQFGVLSCGFEVDSSNDPRPVHVCGGSPRLASTGKKVPFDTEEGAFTQGAWVVPLPASAWLLIAGLGGLAAIRKRSSQKPA